MTAGEAAERRPARTGWLLRMGTRAAASSLAPLLVLGGVLAVGQAVQRALWPALLAADPALRLDGTLLLAAAGVLLAGTLARAVVVAVGVQIAAARLRTAGAAEPVAPAVAGLRGIAWAAVLAILDLLLSAWFWAVLVSGGVALALGGPVVSLLGAVGVAGVLTAGAFLGPAVELWLELGLVTSVVRPLPMSAAAGEALSTLLARPGVPIAAWLVTAIPVGMTAAGVQLMAAGAPGPGASSAAALGVAVLLVGLLEALGTLVRLDTLAALVLDRADTLPQEPRPPPAPPPVPRATLVGPEVVEARPVGPVAPWAPGESR